MFQTLQKVLFVKFWKEKDHWIQVSGSRSCCVAMPDWERHVNFLDLSPARGSKGGGSWQPRNPLLT